MSEDPTKDLPNTRPFEERVLAELSAMRTDFSNRFDLLETRLNSMETRLTSLEDKVDARLRETRPIWEGVQTQLKGIEKQLDDLNRQFKTLIQDSFNLRVRVEKLEDNQQTA